MRIRWLSLGVFFLGLIAFGFPGDGRTITDALAQSESGTAGMQMKRIGVVPFFKGRSGSSIGETLTCPICQLDLGSEELSPHADLVLTDYVREAVDLRFGENVIPPSEVKNAFDHLSKDETRDTPLSIAQSLGKALKAELMILGSVWRYRERAGGAAAVDTAASVAFAVFLIDVETGKTLWKADFAETQKSLSENILEAKGFFKKGGRWLSASELARYGVREVFKRFPR